MSEQFNFSSARAQIGEYPIVEKLDEIKEVLQPLNPCLDIDISIPVSGWSSSAPYVYNYSNSHITSGCSVKFDFINGSENASVLYLDMEKTVGGVQFTAPTKPNAEIPVRLHILNADAESVMATTADEVSTSAVTGASNVEDALGSLAGGISSLSNQIAQKTALNSNTATSSYGTVRYNTFGKVVVVCGDMNFASSLSAGTIIATGLPIPYYMQPSTYNQNGYMGTIISSNNSISACQIDKDGNIIANTPTVTSYCRLFITYLSE